MAWVGCEMSLAARGALRALAARVHDLLEIDRDRAGIRARLRETADQLLVCAYLSVEDEAADFGELAARAGLELHAAILRSRRVHPQARLSPRLIETAVRLVRNREGVANQLSMANRHSNRQSNRQSSMPPTWQ